MPSLERPLPAFHHVSFVLLGFLRAGLSLPEPLEDLPVLYRPRPALLPALAGCGGLEGGVLRVLRVGMVAVLRVSIGVILQNSNG